MIFGLILVTFLLFYQLSPYVTGSLFSQNKNLKVYISSNHNSHLNSYDNLTRLNDKAQSPTTCLIIIRILPGRFGNRMFLFASAYGLARLHQCTLYVAPSILIDLRTVFRIDINQTKVHLTTNDSVIGNPKEIFGRYTVCTLFSDLLRIPLNSTYSRYEMTGFYQAYGYFEKYREEINFLFQFKSEPVSRNVVLVEQLLKAVWNIPLNLGKYTKDNVPHSYLKSLLINPPSDLKPVTWIGIHIRRGDFLTIFKINTSVEYLTWAMNYYRRKYVNCRFVVASDDKKYVETTLGNNTDIFITPLDFSAGDDLAAMGLCEHMIITAGTYGWWAAWLAGGDVVQIGRAHV